MAATRLSRVTYWVRRLPLFVAFFATACVVLPPRGALVPPRVEILKNDPRAGQYGASASEILNHLEMRDKVQRLFGPAWGPDAGRRAAPAFFSKSFPTSVLRVGGAEYIAAPGCVPEACLTDRGLLLIRTDGQRLLARLDEGGFTRYYAFAVGVGIETVGTPQDRATVDAAWRELGRAPGSARAPEPKGGTPAPTARTPEYKVRTPEPKVTWRDKASRCYEDVTRGAMVHYQGRHPGLYLVGRAACDQYAEDMESLERERRQLEAIPPLEIMQLETELRRPQGR